MKLDYPSVQKAVDDTKEELAKANESLEHALYSGDEDEVYEALDQAASAYDGAEGMHTYAVNVPQTVEAVLEGKPDADDLREEIEIFHDLYETAFDLLGSEIPQPRSFQRHGEIFDEALEAVEEGEMTVSEAAEYALEQ